jgi:hypothetical protein
LAVCPKTNSSIFRSLAPVYGEVVKQLSAGQKRSRRLFKIVAKISWNCVWKNIRREKAYPADFIFYHHQTQEIPSNTAVFVMQKRYANEVFKSADPNEVSVSIGEK